MKNRRTPEAFFIDVRNELSYKFSREITCYLFHSNLLLFIVLDKFLNYTLFVVFLWLGLSVRYIK